MWQTVQVYVILTVRTPAISYMCAGEASGHFHGLELHEYFRNIGDDMMYMYIRWGWTPVHVDRGAPAQYFIRRNIITGHWTLLPPPQQL